MSSDDPRSTRMPMNDAALAAKTAEMQNVSLVASPVGAEVTEEGGRRRRRSANARKPFGTHRQRLAYPERSGFHRHWFNDEPGRIERAREAGYEHVLDPAGRPIETVVGVARGGGGMKGYLMEIPQEWYQEDMSAQEAEYGLRMEAIKRGAPTQLEAKDHGTQYVPRDRGISITSNRR